MSVFIPPFPIDFKGNAFLDTSVLRVLILSKNIQLSKDILAETKSAKLLTSDYVVYELRRACLGPIWEFYYLVDRHQDLSIALNHFSQTFHAREAKYMLSVFSSMVADALTLPVSPLLFQNQLVAIAEEIERSIEAYSVRRVNNKTGCSLHKTPFGFDLPFPTLISCKTDCKVENFWKSQSKKIKELIVYSEKKTLTADEKTTFKKLTPHFTPLLADPNYGKKSNICKKLADTLILLHNSASDTLVLSSDNSFVSLSHSTSHKVHQLMSVSSSLGGGPSTVAMDQFKSKNTNSPKITH